MTIVISIVRMIFVMITWQKMVNTETEDEPIASDGSFDENDIRSNLKTVVTFPLELCDRSISGNDLKNPSLWWFTNNIVTSSDKKNLCWFCEDPSISKEALSDSLQAQHDILPPGNCLPVSYKAVHKLIRPYLIPRIEFHACRNDSHF